MKLHPLLVVPVLMALAGIAGCTTASKLGQVLMDPSVPVGALRDQPSQIAFSLHASPTQNSNAHTLDAEKYNGGATPAPYAISLNAGDILELTGKVETLLEYLHDQFPSPPLVAADDEQATVRAITEESSPGSYGNPALPPELPGPMPESAEQLATPVAIKILQLRDDSLLQNSGYELLDEDPAKALRSTFIRADDYVLAPGQFKFVGFTAIEPDTRFIAVIANYRDKENAIWRQSLRIAPRGHQIVLAVLLNDSHVLLKEES
ncbi:type VI secretion system lipoprotein TssJ [Pseudomonas sp. Teo4]|uniref:type VI secretion system lipoprotein TssJ n=1 Tax=Pseudomonas sp. Teo4 TaxID=3064528 RepID=UPI002ABC4F89|nr:type VI secretion system lipoprotein TssJ [Pseudomonas sp. Teo4]MDZ3992502.1 hypothetical protein [Pseudomonas sp. Teo4]